MNEGRIDELQAVPKRMAGSIAPLFEAPNRGRYVRYLQVMVHYTRHSREELDHAASQMPSAALRQLFERLAREEATHYRLAEADLQALDVEVESTAPETVLAIRHFWASVPDTEPQQFLGALYALENVAGFCSVARAWVTSGVEPCAR